jgi:putative membrane protein
MTPDRRKTHLGLLLFTAVVFVWSGTGPRETLTWLLEVFPVVLAAPLLIFTYKRFRFTTLVYTLITAHAVILLVGGHYTYAEVPLFNWIRDSNGFDRNYYDRVGHFAQGFAPAMIAREFLLRKTNLERGMMLNFLVFCICMTISASYEILEFAIAKLIGDSSEHFLGTQGDVWDTQWDMTFCFAGTVLSLLLLTRWQDRQMKNETPAQIESLA